MKNIHLLLSDKPSRLHEFGGVWFSHKKPTECFRNYNIYITSDEEIKEGDVATDSTVVGYYSLDDEGCPILKDSKCESGYSFSLVPHCKKIILTTDQDLIADGVQEIDDEFLEWLVNNPTCEFVKVDLIPVNTFGSEITVNGYGFDKFIYKIIIPKEENIQIQQMEDRIMGRNVDTGYRLEEEPNTNLERLPFPELIKEFAEYYKKVSLVDESNQETLEEAMEKNGYHDKPSDDLWREGVEFGAKWQAEKMYSEEDMFEFSQWISHEDWVYLPSKGYWVNEEQEELEQKLSSKEILNLWFEQFKKK